MWSVVFLCDVIKMISTQTEPATCFRTFPGFLPPDSHPRDAASFFLFSPLDPAFWRPLFHYNCLVSVVSSVKPPGLHPSQFYFLPFISWIPNSWVASISCTFLVYIFPALLLPDLCPYFSTLLILFVFCLSTSWLSSITC